MKTIPALVFTYLLSACALMAGSAPVDLSKSAKSPAPMAPEPWGGSILGGGFKSNGEFNEGSLWMLHPFINNIGMGSTMSGDVLYVEPHFTWGDEGVIGGSLALGYRHLFSNQSPMDARKATVAGLLTEGIFVGGSVSLDYLNSAYDNSFWQIAVGLEAGTRYVEVHANYFIPLSDDETISKNTTVSRTSHTSYSSRTTTSTAGGTTTTTTRRTATTRTTTTVTTTELFEEPLEGWDILLGVLIPGIDRYCDVKLIGGFYSFEGDRSTIDFDGWRAGVEIRPVPAIVVFGHWFERDELYRDNWLAGVRFEIPLSSDWKEAFKPRRRHLAEHLFEPIVRKNTHVTTAAQSQSTSTSTSSTTTSSAGSSTLVTTTDDCESKCCEYGYGSKGESWSGGGGSSKGWKGGGGGSSKSWSGGGGGSSKSWGGGGGWSR